MAMEIKAKEDSEIKDRAMVIYCPVKDFPRMQNEWYKDNPRAKVKEVLKSIFMGEGQEPDPMNIGHTRPVLVPMIMAAFFYREK